MCSKKQFLLALATLFTLLAAGCTGLGSKGIRITEGQQRDPANPTARTFAAGTPLIVHVDRSARIVTLRNGQNLENGFLIATDAAGNDTAVLRALPESAQEGLQTAEILEGSPGINHTVRLASAKRSAELTKVYRDPTDSNE